MPDTPMAGATAGYADQRSVVESLASGVAWPAIIGGAFASVALAVLLFTLGSGLGLAAVSPWANTGASVTTVTVITGCRWRRERAQRWRVFVADGLAALRGVLAVDAGGEMPRGGRRRGPRAAGVTASGALARSS